MTLGQCENNMYSVETLFWILNFSIFPGLRAVQYSPPDAGHGERGFAQAGQQTQTLTGDVHFKPFYAHFTSHSTFPLSITGINKLWDMQHLIIKYTMF